MTFHITADCGNSQVTETAETAGVAEAWIDEFAERGCIEINIRDERRTYSIAEIRAAAAAAQT